MASKAILIPSILFFISLCGLFPAITTASFCQEKTINEQPSPNEQVSKTRGIDSELNGAILDDLFAEAEAIKATVMIISRLGKGELNIRSVFSCVYGGSSEMIAEWRFQFLTTFANESFVSMKTTTTIHSLNSQPSLEYVSR